MQPFSFVFASSTIWSHTYGGSAFDASTTLVQASDGGYILAGFTHSDGNGDSDALLMKIDENGNMLWNKTIGDQIITGLLL